MLSLLRTSWLIKDLLCCFHQDPERISNSPLFGLWDRTGNSDRKGALDDDTGKINLTSAVDLLIYLLCQGILGG